MKRVVEIARSHGIGTVFARGTSRAIGLWRDSWRLLVERLAERRARALPRRPEGLKFVPAVPLVSVAVIGGRDWRFVNRCLRALHNAQSERPLEILIFHDRSIAPEMAMHAGVQLVAVSGAAPFTDLLKQIGERARAPFVYVLDSHAVALPGAVAALAATLEREPAIAAACSRIGAAGGRLREAGRAVTDDGTIQLCGAGSPPGDSRFEFLRDVDAVSPAAFFIRTESLRTALTGATTFTSASWAAADLCFELRSRGFRIVCQPFSPVLCDVEPAANPVASDARTFAGKWLRGEPAGRRDDAGSILFVEEHVPFTDRDAGSQRTMSLVRRARANGWPVVFGSLDKRAYRPYCDELKQAGAEVLLGFGRETLSSLKARGSRFDAVWLSRPAIASRYIAAVRSSQPQSRIVYDTVDLHHLRLARQAGVLGETAGSQEMEQLELSAARASDVTVVTSSYEAAILRASGIRDVAVVGLAETPVEHVPGAENRAGVLFVGNYAHAPNVDAALRLAGEIMPLVWKRIPGMVLTLAGADPTPAVKKLSGKLVRVPGFVRDLAPFFAGHRVFGAPVRFGAGLKGKIVQAMAAGIPVVTTSVGAEGLQLEPEEMIVANDEQSFADAVIRLSENAEEWERYSAGAHRGALRFSPEIQARQFDAVLSA
jgi:glycosyltransferase involved in cell wall biosynthesis